jgi:hypothetical protein
MIPDISATNGYSTPITYILVHEYFSFQITINSYFIVILVKYDDTDVYDPIVFVAYLADFFICDGDWISLLPTFIG